MKIIEVYRKGEAFKVMVDDDFTPPRKLQLKPNGYVYFQIMKDGKRETHYLHRYLMNAGKGEQVDHQDRNPLNNTRENLRIATTQQNRANKVSKNMGVTKTVLKSGKVKYRVRIAIDGKTKHIGSLDSEQEAIELYENKHIELYGEFSPYFKEALL